MILHQALGDAVHDQKAPQDLLHRLCRALQSGGIYLMQDIGRSTHLENNRDFPMAAFLYAVSCAPCTLISLCLSNPTEIPQARRGTVPDDTRQPRSNGRKQPRHLPTTRAFEKHWARRACIRRCYSTTVGNWCGMRKYQFRGVVTVKQPRLPAQVVDHRAVSWNCRALAWDGPRGNWSVAWHFQDESSHFRNP